MDVEIVEETDLQDDLVCSVCYAEFLDKEDLEVHIKQLHLNETNKSRFCEICTHIFPDIEEYALHIRNTHSRSLKCCKYCSRLFKSSVEVQEHEKKHNAAVLYPKVSCSHCKKVFNSKEEVKNHEVKVHCDSIDGFMLKDCLPILSSLLCMNVQEFFNSLPYKCVVCDRTTVDVNAYIQHLVDDDKCRGHACNECCNVYANKVKLGRHMLKHIQGNPNTRDSLSRCRKCGLPFKATSFKSHKKVCTGMRCVLCNLYFNSIAEYTSHRLAEHRAKMPVLEVCIYCQRRMIGVDSLKKHVQRVHKNDKHLYKYHCTDCDRLFKHPKLLFAHFFSSHKDLHPYTCKICDKTFRIRKNFTLHIKLTHKSIGFVEFDDNFHVFFTDKKLGTQSKSQTALGSIDDENDGFTFKNDHDYCENSSTFEEKICKVEIERMQNVCDEPKKELSDVKKSNEEDKENKKQTERNDDVTTDCATVELPDDKKSVRKPVLKRKLNVAKKHKIEDTNDDNKGVSSDDSDVPLKTVSKKLKLQKNQTRRVRRNLSKPARSKKFVCAKCDKDCYTYQNYHRHKALHLKNETKVCIKCYAKFDSVKQLENHIKKEHSSSQLTETLKKLLEKRKVAESTLKTGVKLKQSVDPSMQIPKNAKHVVSMPQKVIPLTTTEKFRNTFKKVNTERNANTKVTMKLIDKDKISVKKYLENFTPESNDVKITIVNDPGPLDTRVKKLRPLIKLTKCPEFSHEYQKARLKMPVKFTDDLKEQCQVSIKLATDYRPPAMMFPSKVDNNLTVNNYDYNDTYDTYEYEAEHKDVIPEVAQEVMLEGTVEQNTIVRTMNLSNIPTWHKVQIAHLSTEAPYFKISKVNLGTESSFTLTPEGNKTQIQDEETPKKIMLPNGKKLISVNPFEHLLNKQAMDELKSSKSRNKVYYKPKIINAAEAIKTALQKLEESCTVKEKKKK
ncbi:zinc finger protein 721-like [Maniola jurtina]|uniref:zinc finger protein 721-like n=1 Tax=Maniola jurtina TaxID=191418 RepID=UPI001E68F06F|nr:zinc finger protein 721-like [Maniola jurtina]